MPSWGEIAQIITALSAVSACLLSWRNSRKIEKVDVKVEQVHLATNSLQDKLVAATATASKAEGVEQGRAEERDRTK